MSENIGLLIGAGGFLISVITAAAMFWNLLRSARREMENDLRANWAAAEKRADAAEKERDRLLAENVQLMRQLLGKAE